MYTEHTDNTGHNKGPNSTEITQAVRDLDDVLMTLMDELEKRNLQDEGRLDWYNWLLRIVALRFQLRLGRVKGVEGVIVYTVGGICLLLYVLYMFHPMK